MASKNVEEIALAARDEASRVISNVASELGDVGNALTRLTALSSPAGIALAAIGLTVGGIVALGAGVSDAVEALDNLSNASGVSVENLQVFREIIKEAGKDPASLDQALRFLNRSIATQDPLLKQLGITTKDTTTAFLQLMDVLGRSNDTGKKNEITFQLLGRGAGDLVGIARQVADGFTGMKGAMESAGGVMSGSTLQAARALDQQMDTLGRNWTGALTHIKAFTVPWANDIVRTFDDVWNALFHRGDDTLPEVERKIADVENDIREAMARLHNAQKGHGAQSGEFVLAQDEFDNDLKIYEARLAKLNDLKAKLDPKGVGAARNQDENVGVVATEDPLKKILVGEELQRAQEEARKWAEKVKEAAGAAKMLGMTADEAARAFDKLDKNKKGGEIFKAIRESMQPAGPPLPDEIYKLNLALDQLAVMMGRPRDEAVKLADDLMSLKRTAADGFPISTAEQQAAVESLNKKISETAALLDTSTAAAAVFVQAMAERDKHDSAIDTRKKLGVSDAADGLTKVKEKFADMIGTAQVVEGAFDAAFAGMTSGAEAFFSQLNSNTHVLTSLVTHMWKAMADEAIRQLIRIETVKALFKLASLFFVPGTAIAPNNVLGGLPVPAAPPAVPLTAGNTSVLSRPLPQPTAAKAATPPPPVRLVVPPLPKLDQKVTLAVPPFADVRLMHDLDRVFARGVTSLAALPQPRPSSPALVPLDVTLMHDLDRVFIDGAARIAEALPDTLRLSVPTDFTLSIPRQAPATQKPAQAAAAPSVHEGDTYIIQALDVGNAYGWLTGPNGPLRRSMDRALIGSAY